MSEDLQALLEAAFAFGPADREANRAGRLSRTQEARLGAAGGAARIALAIFALATLGSVGAVVLSSLPEGVELRSAGPVAAALAAGLAVVVGIAVSRPYRAALRGRKLEIAEGAAQEEAREDTIRIGRTQLRLPSPAQRAAFAPGEPYRVFYLAGPVAIVLSAELLGGAPARGASASSPAEEEARAAADPTLRIARYARWLIFGLGAFVLQVLALIVASPALSARESGWLVAALFAQALGFLGVGLFWLLRR